MKKIHIEIIVVTAFVLVSTWFAYNALSGVGQFWNAQKFWSVALIICWVVVASGYYHQGSVIHKAHSSTHVSAILPIAVFFVQCILFVKGIYYGDKALIIGAVLVNSGVVFDLYQISKSKK